MRDGKLIRTFTKEEFDADQIRTSMIGRELQGDYYRSDYDTSHLEQIALKAENLCLGTELQNVVAVENLNMKGMSQALHFGKSTMDNGYGSFLNKLEYKLERIGKTFIKIDRFYPSSKRCSCCGRIKEVLIWKLKCIIDFSVIDSMVDFPND